jgi:hypothetical protein
VTAKLDLLGQQRIARLPVRGAFIGKSHRVRAGNLADGL